MSEAIRRGDVVLVDNLGHGWIARSIEIGQWLRHRNSPYAKWTHIAVVYDTPSQDPHAIRIVEATSAAGVHWTYLSKYSVRCAIVHMSVSDADWDEMKTFLDDVMKAREPYDPVAYAGLTLYALTGTHICIQRAGTATCSGLVADALTRAGLVWTRPPYASTPADIATDLNRLCYDVPIDFTSLMSTAR